MTMPIHARQQSQMHGFSRDSSVRSTRNLGEIEEEEEEEEVEVEKVYVAVGKEYKESKETLMWALRNISRDKKIVLVHVHRPSQTINIMGANFHVNQLTQGQVRVHRQREWKGMEEVMEQYLALCAHAKVEAEKLVLEVDDVATGLVDLVARHGIGKLVMGAAAERQYSKKMKAPKSKIAIKVNQLADQSCKMWFVCRGNLICTRDTVLDGSVTAGSPTASLNSSPGLARQLKSRSLPQRQTETLPWLTEPTKRSMSVDYDPVRLLERPFNGPTNANLSTADVTSIDPWEGISGNFQAPNHSTSSVHDEMVSGMDPLPTSTDEDSEKDSVMLPSVHESEEDPLFSTTSLRMENNVAGNELYVVLQHALKEAEESKSEAFEESRRRRKAEIAAIAAAQKVKVSGDLCAKEIKQRRELEVILARERAELEKLKAQNDELKEELQKANEKKAQLELQIAESEQIITNFQEKLLAAKCLLSSLQSEHEDLRKEREQAIEEAEGMRQRREEAASSTQGVMNFMEFTYADLEQATSNFDDSLKIGEGGYGSVYKGFLRHTVVAIKMLNSESMQGKAEFYQEVEILSRVKHPNLITLIGTCPEAWALVYEYLPEGSLEDRLLCKDNTPPLPWHVRIRISAEICSALIFLHSYKPHTIVHGDLKPANILLDSNFKSKLGDFGICRLLVQSDTSVTLYKRTNPKGTFAYMDPEFLSTWELTPQSDVYSFGIIILRLLTGKPAIGIAKEVKEAVERGHLHEILDVSAGDWPFVQAKQLTNLALRCCEIKRKNRPELAREAWKVLEPMVKATLSMGSLSGSGCIPSYFICPIFQEIMRDPQIAADGFTYEAEALKGWLDSGHDTSPMTNDKLEHRDFIPNRALRSAIQEWLQKQM